MPKQGVSWYGRNSYIGIDLEPSWFNQALSDVCGVWSTDTHFIHRNETGPRPVVYTVHGAYAICGRHRANTDHVGVAPLSWYVDKPWVRARLERSNRLCETRCKTGGLGPFIRFVPADPQCNHIKK